jgi:hypothetical protein
VTVPAWAAKLAELEAVAAGVDIERRKQALAIGARLRDAGSTEAWILDAGASILGPSWTTAIDADRSGIDSAYAAALATWQATAKAAHEAASDLAQNAEQLQYVANIERVKARYAALSHPLTPTPEQLAIGALRISDDPTNLLTPGWSSPWESRDRPLVRASAELTSGATSVARVVARVAGADMNGATARHEDNGQSDPTSGALSMGAVASFGSSPPAITFTGTITPSAPPQYTSVVDFRMECTTPGARGVAVVRMSTDAGKSWTTGISTAPTMPVLRSFDGATPTGFSISYPAAIASADNVWTARSVLPIPGRLFPPTSWHRLSVVVRGNTLSFQMPESPPQTAWWERAAAAPSLFPSFQLFDAFFYGHGPNVVSADCVLAGGRGGTHAAILQRLARALTLPAASALTSEIKAARKALERAYAGRPLRARFGAGTTYRRNQIGPAAIGSLEDDLIDAMRAADDWIAETASP